MQRRQIVALSVAACAIAGVAAYWYYELVASRSSNLVSYLPADNASVIYIDVDALRRSSLLGMLSGSKSTEEPDYRQFVEETKFDYARDLDAVAAAVKDSKIYFALRGRFRWSSLADYAARQGGSCHKDFCVVPGSQPNRRISFYLLKRDVLALAVAPDDFAAYQVAKQSARVSFAAPVTPNDPMWAVIPAAALQSADTLPAAAQAFVPALRGAAQIVLSIGADRDRQLQLGLHVTCKDAPAATALLTQLQGITKELRDLIVRQHGKPAPSDLSGLLVAGNFRQDAAQVYGSWPIPKAFVDAIAGTVY